MEHIDLSFQNKHIEKSYRSLKKSTLKSLMIALMVLLIIMLTMFISRPWQKTLLDHYLLVLCVILCLVPIFFYSKIEKYQFSFVVFSGGLIYLTSMYLRAKNLDGIPAGSLFLKGYNFGLIHMVTQLALAHFPHILSLELMFFFIRIFVNVNLSWGDIIHQVFTSTYMIIVRYVLEKADRRQFYNFYESRENLEKFKDLMANYLPSGILVLDKPLKNTYFINEKFKSYLDTDYKFEDISVLLKNIKYDKEKNRKCLEIPKASSIEDFLKEAAFDFNPTDKARTFYCSYIDKTNSKKSFEASIFPFIWDDNDALIVLLNDVTAQESLISLKLANDTKEQVISTVSHELRTPVSGLLGMLQIMVKKCTNQEMKNYISICKTNTNLLLSFLNSILDLQQIKANRLKLNLTKIDIRKLLNEIVPLFEFQCNQKCITLQLDVLNDLPTIIYSDRARLAQVIINLISNALKFTMKGQIALSAQLDKQDQGRIFFSVSDTGVGIKEEDKARLFNSFHKLECNSEMNPHGAGLGLTISNSLVRLLNKSEEGIKFESEWTRGTRFWFRVPIYPTDEDNQDPLVMGSIAEERANIEHRLPPPIMPVAKKRFQTEQRLEHNSSIIKLKEEAPLVVGSQKEKHILLVDDNPFNVLIAQQLIERLEIKVMCAYNGNEAIEAAKQLNSQGKAISLIFMDCMMPIMNGYEATKKLREMMKKRELPHIPIIALSAGDDEQDKKNSLESGMDEHMCKPLNESELIRVLERHKIV